MVLDELKDKSVLILGFGTEGQSTYAFIREKWPSKLLVIADKRPLEEFADELANRLRSDPRVLLRFGPEYLDTLVRERHDVIVKTPGIPGSIPQIVGALTRGAVLSSHSEIFMRNYDLTRVIGITGTKGKSTTAALIHHFLRSAGIPAELAGNIGEPPLLKLKDAGHRPYFVHEFSSHQLVELTCSPHIAVMLNVVPEHLDYYLTFEAYVSAKENITRFQSAADYLIFSRDCPIPSAVAERTRSRTVPCSSTQTLPYGCYVSSGSIRWSGGGTDQLLIELDDVPMPGSFNLQNVMAAAAAAVICGVDSRFIRESIKTFQPLPHRMEHVGTYSGITFYDDSIATVPEATLAALEALGSAVQTLILGGYDRHLNFDHFGAVLPETVRTLILFEPSGRRIWDAVCQKAPRANLPEHFFVESMEEAVRMAYSKTDAGKICLLSPASPSFGSFADYKDRGETFKKFIRELGTD